MVRAYIRNQRQAQIRRLKVVRVSLVYPGAPRQWAKTGWAVLDRDEDVLVTPVFLDKSVAEAEKHELEEWDRSNN